MAALVCSSQPQIFGSNNHKQTIQTPIEADFLSHFNQDERKLDQLCKIRVEYGADKLSEINDLYPFVIERIIHSLMVRDRQDEIPAMIALYMEYYNDYNLNNILSINLKNETLLSESWPCYLYGHDRMGHPIFYDEIGSANVTKICKVFRSAANGNGEDDILRIARMFRFKFYAKMTRYKQLQSQRYGTTILKHILVMDLKHFSFLSVASNLNFYAKIARTVITDEQVVYPETLHRLLVINCPQSFMICWKVISTVIDAGVLEKIKLLGGGYLGEMLKDIDIEQIPPRYGGKAKWKVRLGDVPETGDAEQKDDEL